MLNDLLRHHKKTVFFSKKGGNSVAVILKPKINDEGYPLRGYTNFTGFNFVDGDNGYFGDSFELTINADDLFAKTISYSGIQNNFHIDIPEILSYEKQLEDRKNDIKKFTELAISDVENLSHNDLVMEIYKNGFCGSEFESEILSELSNNEKLLKDLGL